MEDLKQLPTEAVEAALQGDRQALLIARTLLTTLDHNIPPIAHVGLPSNSRPGQ